MNHPKCGVDVCENTFTWQLEALVTSGLEAVQIIMLPTSFLLLKYGQFLMRFL